MSWMYFACVGPDVDPVEASASRNPEETLAWVERAMKKAEKKFTNWQCRVYRVSADMKAEAVSRYTKPIGVDQKTEIIFHKETL
jgi:hypothetical protein